MWGHPSLTSDMELVGFFTDETTLLYIEGTDGFTKNCWNDSNRSLRIESEYACRIFFQEGERVRVRENNKNTRKSGHMHNHNVQNPERKYKFDKKIGDTKEEGKREIG